ncbi:restriction endonuclease subunit S [Emticicia sp. TH156]|uniref:restriction endonuclease subunit S n=1 Tax=Emticicia sp. TH156 TaxID=2067454 RepID=UPI00130441E8|nr:restriction endonuclease subunit S [Emticicia sp. TH156]
MRQQNRQLLAQYDELLQSTFIELFGDPVKNPKGWEVKKLREFGKIQTGNTPSRNNEEFYGDFIEWIKTDNINSESIYIEPAKEYLSEKGLKLARMVDKGAILVTCIAGSLRSIGNVALTNRRVSFNQQINSISQNEKTNSMFLYT